MLFRKNVAKTVTFLLACCLVFSGCSIADLLAPFVSSPANSSSALSPNLGATAEAGEDFYHYVNADWIAAQGELDANPSVSTFSENHMNNLTDLYFSLEANIKDGIGTRETDMGKLTRFYEASKDFAARNEQGLAPLMPYLNKVKSATTIAELQLACALLDKDGLGSFITFSASPDWKDSTTNRLYLSGPLLGLAEKSLYDVSEGNPYRADNQTTIASYQDTLTRLLMETGETKEAAAQTVALAFSMESRLAASTLSLEEAVNSELTYNKMTMDELAVLTPNFDVADFLAVDGINNPEFVIVLEKAYYEELSRVMVPENLEALRGFVITQLLFHNADFFSETVMNIARDFVNVQNGTSGYLDEISVGLNQTQVWLPELMGQLFVSSAFSEEGKEEATKLVENVLVAFEDRLQNLDWMSAPTKEEAIKKLKAMNLKVGYPDEWTDYSGLTINSYATGGNVFQNSINVYHHGQTEFLASIDKPVDKSDWKMGAYETNAYYNKTANEFVIPAGILQAPFFSTEASESWNYGAIGSIVAHEISHAFDEDGRKYDENGTMNDWWTPADLENFQVRTEALVAQYDAFELFPGYPVNGSLTLDENIADLGALSCISQIVGGLPTGDYEEMFQAYAVIYREKSTETYAKRLLVEDNHSPSICRVNLVVRNIPAFYEVYAPLEGSQMYLSPESRVSIW